MDTYDKRRKEVDDYFAEMERQDRIDNIVSGAMACAMAIAILLLAGWLALGFYW